MKKITPELGERIVQTAARRHELLELIRDARTELRALPRTKHFAKQAGCTPAAVWWHLARARKVAP